MARRSIRPLIDALVNGDEKVRSCAVEALVDITGEDFGQDRGAWQAWWDTEKKQADKKPRGTLLYPHGSNPMRFLEISFGSVML